MQASINGVTVIVRNLGVSASGHQLVSVEDKDGIVLVQTAQSVEWALRRAACLIERHDLREEK